MPNDNDNNIPPESMADVDLSTVAKLGVFLSDFVYEEDPKIFYRAIIFHLKAKERAEKKFRLDTVEVVKDLLKRVEAIEQLLSEDAPPVTAPAAPTEQVDRSGPGYAPVDNLPFPTSGPLGTKPTPVVQSVNGNGAAPAPTPGDAPAGQNNSQVVDVKPLSATPQMPNNSRVTNISPIPQGKVR